MAAAHNATTASKLDFMGLSGWIDDSAYGEGVCHDRLDLSRT